MKTLSCVLVCAIAVVFGISAAAQPLDGRKLVLEAGAIKSVNPIIAIPCDAPETDDVIRVFQEETAKSFPATLRNGELVFIPEGAMPGAALNFTVKTEKKTDKYVPKVVVAKVDAQKLLTVTIEDVHFTSFNYSEEYKKAFLWPVKAEGGLHITRDFPMETEGTPRFALDHPHHKSLWTAYGEVNGVDLWAEGANSGTQVSGEPEWGSGDAYGWITVKNTWQDKDGKALITEAREYRFYATPEKGRMLDVIVTFSADYGEVVFTDTKEGGIASVRMSPDISGKNAVITNAFGNQGENECWGKPSPWCDFSGEFKDAGWRGLTIFDHPSNLRHPSSWHVRNYGLMGANCFGWSYFAEKDYNKGVFPAERGDYTFASGDSLMFSYRIYVHSGDVQAAAVGDRYADYATPPAARWVE